MSGAGIFLAFGVTGGFYLHHFISGDTDRVLHDHPALFVSIGLCGGYAEEFRPDGLCACPIAQGPYFKKFKAPWFRWFPATYQHRIVEVYPNTWTLVYTGKRFREWGFWPGGEFVQWREYVEAVRGHFPEWEK